MLADAGNDLIVVGILQGDPALFGLAPKVAVLLLGFGDGQLGSGIDGAYSLITQARTLTDIDLIAGNLNRDTLKFRILLTAVTAEALNAVGVTDGWNGFRIGISAQVKSPRLR